jgi:hypothetical protein
MNREMNSADSTRQRQSSCAECQDAGVGTGWAQVQYKYGNMLIMFQTIKIVLLGRGAQ